MKLRFLLVTACIWLNAASEAAGQCGAETWFDLTAIETQCPLADSVLLTVFIPFAESYIASRPPAVGSDADNVARLAAIESRRAEILLTLQPLAVDLKAEDPAEPFTVNRGGFAADFRTDYGIGSFRLVFPPGALLCDGEPLEEETVVEVQPAENDSRVNCTSGNEASRPPDWRIDLAPADDDAEDDAGVTVEFEFEKDWGYNFQLNRVKKRWSTNLWRLKVDGSGATNDANFYDSVKADFSWSYSRSYVADAVRRRPIPALWGSVFARPETTFDGDHQDYVYGARVEVITNLRRLIGTDFGTGTRPYLSLGFERVDPAKREDGTVPDNYERLAGTFLWKFSPLENVRVEADWEAKYFLSDDDLEVLGLDDRLQDKLALSVAYDPTGDGEFLPFLKYTRGTEAPGFEVVDELLVGFAWDFLFQDERP